MPFGQLETNLVNDALAETLIANEESVGFRQSAGMLSWEEGIIGLHAYVFNSREDQDDELSDYGVRFSVGDDAQRLSIDYLSDVSDSVLVLEALQASLTDPNAFAADELSAISINGYLKLGAISVLAEHVQTDDLDEIGFIADDAPSVSQLDVGLTLNDNWAVAIGYQQTNDAVVLGLPETRLTAGFTTTIYEGVIGIGVEVWQEEDYSKSDGGTADDINGLTIKMEAAF